MGLGAVGGYNTVGLGEWASIGDENVAKWGRMAAPGAWGGVGYVKVGGGRVIGPFTTDGDKGGGRWEDKLEGVGTCWNARVTS